MNIRAIFIKILKKVGALQHLNFITTFRINRAKVKIPILKGLGYPNVFLKTNWLYKLIENFCINEGDFVDVGINIGQTLIALKTINNSISYLGFEPNVSCLYYLNELIVQNKYKNCQIFGLALSNKLQILQLEINEESDSAGSIVKNLRPNYFKKKKQF